MLATNNNSLNEFLNSGKSGLWLVYGPGGSGKTTLALQASLFNSLNGKKVLFLDTEKGFSLDRLKLMNKEYEKILDNLFLISVKDFEDQCNKLNKLDNLVNDKIGLVVIDSFGNFYRKALQSGDVKEINSKVIDAFRSLKHISKRGVPVLVTNQVYENEQGFTPIGGNLVKNFADSIIELNFKPRKILFRKPVESTKDIKINNEGIYF